MKAFWMFALAATMTFASSALFAADNSATSEVRDWSEVDTNQDNLVSPEEMEAYLEANRPE
ncbi:MAG: hypothetical protein AB8C46_04970 [Burkholderiaceae bacterium]